MWRCGEQRTLVHCWWECKLVQPLWKTAWRHLKKLKTELPYDSNSTFGYIYTKETKSLSPKDICTPMFNAVLFAIANTGKQHKCPLAGIWIKCKKIHTYISHIHGLPRWHSGKESACQYRRLRTHGFNHWVGKILWRREWQPTTHSSILAWEIPWTEDPGWVQSMGSQRVRHDWKTEHAYM